MPNGSHLPTTAAWPEGEAVKELRSTEGRVLAERTGIDLGPDYISERMAAQIIADSIRLYLRNFLGIFLVYAAPIFPLILLSASVTASRDQNLITTGFEVLKVVVTIFTLGAMTIAVSDVCLGNRPSIKRSYAALGQVFWSYLGTYLLFLAVSVLSLAVPVVGVVLVVSVSKVLGVLVLCVSLVLLLYAATALLFCLPVCIIERRSPIDACRRSMALGKGHYLRNLGVMFLAELTAGVIVVMTIIIGTIIIGFGIGMIVGASGFGLMALKLIIGLLGAMVSPLFQVPVVLLYYDLRVRKENFDGAALAQELMT